MLLTTTVKNLRSISKLLSSCLWIPNYEPVLQETIRQGMAKGSLINKQFNKTITSLPKIINIHTS